jgi:hypothetical protein
VGRHLAVAVVALALSGCYEPSRVSRGIRWRVIPVTPEFVELKARHWRIEKYPGARLEGVWTSTDRVWWRIPPTPGERRLVVAFRSPSHVAMADFCMETP